MLWGFGSFFTFSVFLNGMMFAVSNQDPGVFRLKSSGFEEQAKIPMEYTCKGKNQSPALSWVNAPKDTQSFALVVRDPDAPSGDLIHWIVFNIPHTSKHLPEGIRHKATMEGGIYQGLNDYRHEGYDGPCPPPGRKHSYIFTLYALDTKLHLNPGASISSFRDKIEGHVLGEATLTGTFETADSTASSPSR